MATLSNSDYEWFNNITPVNNCHAHAFRLLTNKFCGKTNLKGWNQFSQCSQSAIPASGMWFYLIRDHESPHWRTPHTPFLISSPHGSLGCPELVEGQCCKDGLIVPCCQRLPGPASSHRGCICCVPCPIFFLPCQLHFTGVFKTYFQNICKPKWLQIFEQQNKGWQPNQLRSLGAVWDPVRLAKWAIPLGFPNIFECIFLIWSSSSVFMPPPK